jgi:FKBP-type peptidyl-prolyl cis-trans isomerase SlyD
MNIASDSVVQIHYTLKNDAGEVLDASEVGEPLTYLHGHGNLIPGLERELEGKGKGAKLNVSIQPADGYGEHDDKLVQKIPRNAIDGGGDIIPGMQVHAQTDEGTHALTVTHVDDQTVTLDGNHPLAGQTLHFEVEIGEVRAATEEELVHGHVHGPGGAHH